MKPIIGITCKERNSLIKNYVDAITEFGGEPKLFVSSEKPISEHQISVPGYLKQIHGLLLPGGGDINPLYYSEVRHKTVRYVSHSRDILETNMFQMSMVVDIPVLGICRGVQVMNVALGGDLCQDIESLYPQEPINHNKVDREDSIHEIKIVKKSRLSEIVNGHHATVNSAHHQAVDMVSSAFDVAAHTETGIIEAMEISSSRFVIGVQYNPERMLKNPSLRGHAEKLFKAFIDAASTMM